VAANLVCYVRSTGVIEIRANNRRTFGSEPSGQTFADSTGSTGYNDGFVI
jgi:hypothetical protein